MSDHGRGFVCIHREIMDHWVWQDKPVSKGQAWVDLILLANYRSGKFSYKDGVVEGRRGCVYHSISFLAERWGWSRDKASRFLHQLESDGMIKLFATTHHTTITLVNYEVYQGMGATDMATDRQPTAGKPAANRQQVGTYNKDNKGNHGNKGNNSESAGEVQSAEEIEEASRWFESL